MEVTGNLGEYMMRPFVGASETKPRMLSCDEVAWLRNVLERFEDVVRRDGPRMSRGIKAAKLAAILEIAELMGCAFADDAAKHNVISDFPELYQGHRADAPKVTSQPLGYAPARQIVPDAPAFTGGKQ